MSSLSLNHAVDRAFVLHISPYRETSQLVDVFTEHFGRLSLLAKGSRTLKSPMKGLLQPFQCLQLEWRGKASLKTIISADLLSPPWSLQEKPLMAGFYLNELLVRLLPREEGVSHLFQHYQQAVIGLAANGVDRVALRLFERALLEALGYAIAYSHTADTHQAISPDLYYNYVVEHGFVEVGKPVAQSFLGIHIQAIACNNFEDRAVLQAAQRLYRLALSPLLGNKPLRSRELANFLPTGV